MTAAEIIRQRLINQQIAGSTFTRPAELVAWMGALQAQEFRMARWAIGLRIPSLTDDAIKNAFNSGEFLRTHILRPTWHFVAPADIRWILALTSPRVKARSAYAWRQTGLTEAIFKRSNAAIAKALRGGRYLTRQELQSSLQHAGILAEGQRLGNLMMRAELDGIICSGPRREKQFTYALLEERVAPVKSLDRDAALARLSELYFRSRGPATAQDFAWWSGLTVRDARDGAATVGSRFAQKVIDGRTYIFPKHSAKKTSLFGTTFLLPEYDEYGLGYKDRSAMWSPNYDSASSQVSSKRRKYCVVVNGLIAGTWQRREKDRAAIVDSAPLRSLTKTQRRAVMMAVKRYDLFVSPLPR